MDGQSRPNVLARDLVAADGRVVARAGAALDLDLLRKVGAQAPSPIRQRPLHETAIASAVLDAFEAPALVHLVGTAAARAEAANTVAEVRFPDAVWEELDLLRTEDPSRFTHALWSALVAARLFRASMGEAPGLIRMVGGALLHDIGMRYAAPKLRWKREHLTAAEAAALEDHPLFGAVVLASALGDAPAVHFALLHHTRSGHGYPRLRATSPLRGLELIAVASAFAAMVAPRSFRPQPYNPRGAADQLLEETKAGHFDERAVRLLIHCLRGARGPLQELQLPAKATGFRPPKNQYGVRLAAAARR